MHYTKLSKVSQIPKDPFPNNWERYQRLEGTTVIGEMKKYYKLVLSVITFASVICFIFYKTQYDRLYNVLEVLEFFGANEKAGLAATGACSPLLMRPPNFQRLSDELFTFSSFCQLNPDSVSGECPRITTVALLKAGIAPENLDIKCELWYEGSAKPVKGIFTSSPFPKFETLKSSGSSFLPINFNCESKYITKVPYGITFTKNAESSFSHVEDYESSTLSPQSHTLGACILPPPTPSDDTTVLLQTILLNSHFGLANFLLYDSGLTHKFFVGLAKASKTRLRPNVHIMPWNPPSGSLSRQVITSLVEQDCSLRSKALFQTWLVMNSTQVLVVRGEHPTVQEALVALDKPVGGHLQVSIREFCSELPTDAEQAKDESTDHPKYKMPALSQSSYYDPESEGLPHKSLNLAHHISPKSTMESVGDDLILVHDYAPCRRFDFPAKTVKTDRHLSSLAPILERRLGAFFDKDEEEETQE